MAKQDKAGRGERLSALWGTTRRDGDSKSSALWGNGGRGLAVLLTAILAMVLPFAAVAGPGDKAGAAPQGSALIPDTLLSQAQSDPNGLFRVIVQGDGGHDAEKVAKKVAKFAAQANKQLADAEKKAHRPAGSRGRAALVAHAPPVP